MDIMKVRDIIAQNLMVEEAEQREQDPRVIVIGSGDNLLWRSGSVYMRVIA